MANANKKVAHETQAGHRPSLWPKIAVAATFILAAQILVAQQPAPEIAVREQVDAQNFKYQEPNEKLRKNKTDEGRFRSQARAVLNGTASISEPAARLQFHGFYLSYLFPMMTTEEGLRTIGKERYDFLRDLGSAKNLEAHREVVDFTLRAMTKIVQDPAYRPAARYNAMLIISSLNDVEPNNIGATPTLPEPTKAALQTIFQQFQKADRDEIKIAALIGLARHLEWDNYKQPQAAMQPAARALIIKELVALAEAKEPPAGREASVHLWMRRRAVEALSLACLTKADADITAVMERLLRDEAEPTTLRLAVATAFGKMSLQAPAKLDPVATAKELGYLALKATDAEITRAEAHRKAELEHEARLAGNYQGDISTSGGLGGMPGGIGGRMPGGEGGGMVVRRSTGMPGGGSSLDGAYGGGMPGGEMGMLDPSLQDPKQFEVEYLRRRLRQNLYAVQLGLLGNEDHTRSKTTTKAAPPATGASPPATPTGNTGEKKGMYAIAKTEPEKKQVDEVYFAVRDLAEAVESAGTTAEFHQLLKDVKNKLKPLELVVGRRAPPPGAPVDGDEGPAVGPVGKAGPKGPAGKGKAIPGKAKPGLPAKAANRQPPPPNVLAKPGVGR